MGDENILENRGGEIEYGSELFHRVVHGSS